MNRKELLTLVPPSPRTGMEDEMAIQYVDGFEAARRSMIRKIYKITAIKRKRIK